MKRFTLSLVVACTLCATAVVAQMGTGGASQGTQQNSPSMNSPRADQQPGAQPSTAPMGQDQTTNNNGKMANGEHKMKGCVQSQGSQYMLETKKGKMVALTGQDVSADVGHEVAVKGTWSNMSDTSAGSSAEKTFNVTDVKSISDSCGGKHAGMSNSGSGMGNSSTGGATGTQSPSGTGSQPPQ